MSRKMGQYLIPFFSREINNLCLFSEVLTIDSLSAIVIKRDFCSRRKQRSRVLSSYSFFKIQFIVVQTDSFHPCICLCIERVLFSMYDQQKLTVKRISKVYISSDTLVAVLKTTSGNFG